MTIGIVSRLDVPRNRRGGLERIGPNSGPVKKSAKAPTPLKTPVQIVDPEDRPWRTQYRRTSLRLVQLTSRRLVLRGRFRLPTDFSHSVFITFGRPAGPWQLPHGRGLGKESSRHGTPTTRNLNAANTITAAEFLSMGLRSLTPAHDLNAAQVAELARGVGGDRVEAILYQHLPVFHTEHCVFCRFLSTGTSYRDCGRPCESHTVELRDPAGRAHPVMADVGCRNTVFGAEAQEASRHLDEWRAAGIAHFRLEFAHESGEQVTAISSAFARALTGSLSARELGQEKIG